MLKNQSDQNEVNKIARILESYLMRRLVCKRSTNNYSDLFSQSLIGARFLTALSLQEYLESKENLEGKIKGVFISDGEIFTHKNADRRRKIQ